MKWHLACSVKLCHFSSTQQLHAVITFTAGATEVPVSPSSRIVFLFLLLLSAFMLTSYSAIIVSLLQTTSSAINSITELMNSQFKLSMRNITYSITYVNVSTWHHIHYTHNHACQCEYVTQQHSCQCMSRKASHMSMYFTHSTTYANVCYTHHICQCEYITAAQLSMWVHGITYITQIVTHVSVSILRTAPRFNVSTLHSTRYQCQYITQYQISMSVHYTVPDINVSILTYLKFHECQCQYIRTSLASKELHSSGLLRSE